MATGDIASVRPDLHRFEDTCNVYVLKHGRRAVLIDFGRGDVLDHLDELGIDEVTDVLVTHHHRDQVQGLDRAVRAGARVWIPPLERELIAEADRHWQRRQVDNDYDLRQDRFSLLHSVPVTGWVTEYAWNDYGDLRALAFPTPGHTVGSVTYLVDWAGERLAFSGDLLYAPGKLWSLAATQWSYTGVEGLVATMSSCHELGHKSPELLLPSHGALMDDPLPALAQVEQRLQHLVDNWREQEWNVLEWYREPWEQLSPHLLRNRTSIATSYALLSDSGGALLLDYGYDICGGMLGPSDRAARRPLLASLRHLKQRYGVERIEVAVPTHYHDDHVAAFNLLRESEGTEIWAADNVAPILEEPTRYDLPCLWHDPIPVARTIASSQPVVWREYELTFHPLPGHTLFASAISFETDGLRVLASGDQQNGGWDKQGDREVLNYQYRNRFRIDDFSESATLYRKLRPDLMISGHWAPKKVTEPYLEMLAERGDELARLHRQILPLEEVDFGAGGFGARIEPYRASIVAGVPLELNVTVKNPFHSDEDAEVELVVPSGWRALPPRRSLRLAPLQEAELNFEVVATGTRASRARIAVELRVGSQDFGQQAEALVNVE
ncbi:MAG: fold metallo-hydrolase [Acidimicrobiaceae bacterium]|nr:fold metallo-hydrolase [Acidimicrobiaceae bacterium]